MPEKSRDNISFYPHLCMHEHDILLREILQ
jgi:hypothetical protein